MRAIWAEKCHPYRSMPPNSLLVGKRKRSLHSLAPVFFYPSQHEIRSTKNVTTRGE